MKKKKPHPQQLVGAINRHDVQLLRKLLAEGADPNAIVHDEYHGNIPVLLCAAGVQFLEGVQTLLDAGADPNASMTGGLGTAGGGRTAIHDAISGKDTSLEIVDVLLKAGADPNAVDQGDTLPLYAAASAGNYDVAQRLIEAGATFKTWPDGCMPPLIGAVAYRDLPEQQGQARVAEFLVELGAPVDGETADGVTPLMAAAAGGSLRLVNLYLAHGADVNHRAKDGRSPLHCAADFATHAAGAHGSARGEQEDMASRIVRRLIDAGADPTARTYEGKTAYDIATRFGRNPIIAEYLKKLSAPAN